MSAFRELDVPGGVHAGVWEPTGGGVAGTVLAIHGITSSHKAWEPLARALPDWRIVAPDLRGRGRSNALPGPYGMAQHADDVAALAAELGRDHVVPVGHSMGAFVALELSHRHPMLMDRLIMVDGGLPLPLPEGVAPEDAVDAILGPASQRLSMTFDSVEEYVAFWRDHPALAEWTDDIEAYARYDLVGTGAPYRPATSYAAMAADYADMVRPVDNPVLTSLAALSIPTTLLRAERGMFDEPGGLLPRDHVDRWAAGLPSLTVEDVPGTNHYTITLSDRGAAAIARAVSRSEES